MSNIRTYIGKIVLSALFLLLCCTLETWAQVEGNKYVSKVQIKPANATLKATLVVNGEDTGKDVGSRKGTEIELAYEGGSNTWWRSAEKGNVNVTVDFKEVQAIDSIYMMTGAMIVRRPVSITIQKSDDGSSWTDFQQYSLHRDTTRYARIRLNETLQTRYLRFYLDGGTNVDSLVIDHFMLYRITDKATIQHKDAKWFDLSEQLGLPRQSLGSFSADERRFDPTGFNIQAAHTYIDTIYMHKGRSIDLYLPTNSSATGGASSTKTYQRWYSFRTNGTFETNHSDDAPYDLLTPVGPTDICRFANGYVGGPISSIAQTMSFYYPTDGEFTAWITDKSSIDNDWYVVACDLSGYTDFSEHFTSKGTSTNLSNDDILANAKTQFTSEGFWEPTISLRVIYYIVGVDGHASTEAWNNGHNRLTNSKYQGGTNTGNEQYLEEYEITFPASHLSIKTDELVALSKDARSYAIPGIDKDRDTQNSYLKVQIVKADDLFELSSTSKNTAYIRNTTRVINFRAKSRNADNTWTVPDGTEATIIVTKVISSSEIYNIARFKLKFVAESVPLTQSQVAKLKEDATATEITAAPWMAYYYRSPKWMEDNLYKLTELTFDYDANVAVQYGQDDYFPFPLAWNNSSYAFFDGSPWPDFLSSVNYNSPKRWFPEFGYYALTNDYVGYGDNGNRNNARPPVDDETGDLLAKGASTYHIYVDASDRPGILARLPFEENLCQGSELFVTAWIKSAAQNGSDDAAVLFTLIGVDADGKETRINQYSSSQIHQTTYLTSEGTGTVPGTGPGTNEWYQLYFSFINDNANTANFTSYILQIENNCASTSGGDFYIDDIKVYLMQPTAVVEQKEYTCVGERTLMNIDINWRRLISRLGGLDTNVEKNGISFCIIDRAKYDSEISKVLSQSGSTKPSVSQVADAIEASQQALFLTKDAKDSVKVMTVYFSALDGHDVYGTAGTLFEDNKATDGRYHFYAKNPDNESLASLTGDFYSNLSPNRPYDILILSVGEYAGSEPTSEEFADEFDEPCYIQKTFYVTAESIIKVNGEVIDPSTDFCVGQVFNFSMQMRVPTGTDSNGNNTYTVIDKGIEFDWFFGTLADFNAANSTYGGVSLQSALTSFRHFYPAATELSETATPPTVSDDVTFTENEYSIIKYYLEQDVLNSSYKQLVLCKEKLDITVREDGLKLVILPIQKMLTDDELKDLGITQNQWMHICWSTIPVELSANGRAPSLNTGFNNVAYPADDFTPCLRMGLQQIKKTATHPIKISLRGAEIVSKGTGTTDPSHLGSITGMEYLYLVNTDDPEYNDIIKAENFDQYSLPIGTIRELYAEEYAGGDHRNDHVTVAFNDNFNAKEGCTYTFMVMFEEKGNDIYTSCYGSFTVDMKVVPEYLVWNGTDGSNWNNDNNWKRLASTDINKTADATDGHFTDGSNTKKDGFVPMLFTKVVMPENSRARLYKAGFDYTDAGSDRIVWVNDKRPAEITEDPSEHIQYDLMVYENTDESLTTEHYRVNLCDQIHFEPGAEMLHSEYLLYNKAWSEVRIPAAQWTSVSVPLQAVYSGDWYTQSSGEQETEYFRPITFTTDYDRINPAVYQRSWHSGATIIENAAGDKTPVSFSPMWSSVYNDASVPYSYGKGYSIKSKSSLMFRFPKDDTGYEVATNKTLDRTNAGKLAASQLVTRNTAYDKATEATEFTVGLEVPKEGSIYYLVGNPFPSALDITKFLEANSDVLEQKYWLTNADGPVVGAGTGGVWVNATSGAAGPYLPPYSAMFVQKKADATSDDVKFTQAMEAFSATTQGTATASLVITAQNDKGGSAAAVAFSDNAANGFKADEDAELMRDLGGNGNGEPYVYTVAGNTAVSVNSVKDLRQIPLGVFAADDDMTTLTFNGVDWADEPMLYDAETNMEEPLTEGFTLTVTGPSHGRYFIRTYGAGGTTDIGTETADAGVTVYSVASRQLIVSSSAPITTVSVYSVGGTLLKQIDADNHTALTINDVDGGVAIVRVETNNLTAETVKVKVER